MQSVLPVLSSWPAKWITESWLMFELMAPYLLLGFFLAGMLRAFIPDGVVAKYLGGKGPASVLNGSLVGVPLPLCSCGVIPFADLLKRQGASKGAITSFLISTPQTGVDSILATYAMLGLPIALWKVITALVSGMVGGLITSLVTRGETDSRDQNADESHGVQDNKPCTDDCTVEQKDGIQDKIKGGLSYGFGMLIEEIAFWLVVGTLAAGAISAFVPDDMLVSVIHSPFLRMLSVLVVAIPLYVCATGSIPVAAALVMKGLPMGGAIVFLIAGPATNIATISVFTKVLGKKTVLVYLAVITLLSLLAGVLFDLVLPGATIPAQAVVRGHGIRGAEGWTGFALAIVLAVLVGRALVVKAVKKIDRKSAGKGGRDMPGLIMVVEGMTCRHCSMTVENALKAVHGVDSVKVDLDSGKVAVQGLGYSPDLLIRAVESKGYKVVSPRLGMSS